MPTDPALDISPCVTDDDYEAWRQVRIAVIPYERTISVAELRESSSPDRLMVLARRDGVVVGHGLADRSSMAGGGSVTPRVLPEHRRHGAGTALLEHLV
jgi:mycothiol synthase